MTEPRQPNEEYYNDSAYTGATQMLGSQAQQPNQPPPQLYEQPQQPYPPQPYGQTIPPPASYGQPNYPMQPSGQPQMPTPYQQQPMAYGQPNYYIPTSQSLVRPLGISIIAVLQYIGAGLLGLATLLVIFAGTAFTREFGSIFGGIAIVVVIIFVALTALLIALGRGLWKLQSWAHIVTTILYGINILSDLVAVVNGRFQASDMVSLVIGGIIITYLLLPKTRALFRR